MNKFFDDVYFYISRFFRVEKLRNTQKMRYLKTKTFFCSTFTKLTV